MNRVKFGIFLALQIPSLVCSLYLFSQYATRPNLRRSIHHHVLFALLCSSFLFVAIPISASEAFFYTSYVRPASVFFCASWTWIHYSTNVGNLVLMAFACGERHWLLFRLNPLRTKWIRVICHYIPIAACMLYPTLFYFVLIYLYPCVPVYDFTQLLCVMPCYFLSSNVANFDTYVNNWVPIFAIPFLSGTLLFRFLLQKRRMHIEMFQWKRDRKMVVQLFSIAALYLCMWSPVQAAVNPWLHLDWGRTKSVWSRLSLFFALFYSSALSIHYFILEYRTQMAKTRSPATRTSSTVKIQASQYPLIFRLTNLFWNQQKACISL